MANVPVPRGIDDVTPEWLTAALGEGGLDVRVAALTKENIGEGVGVNGVTTRLRVDYEPGSAQGPASLVLKLPAALAGEQGNRTPARVLRERDTLLRRACEQRVREPASTLLHRHGQGAAGLRAAAGGHGARSPRRRHRKLLMGRGAIHRGRAAQAARAVVEQPEVGVVHVAADRRAERGGGQRAVSGNALPGDDEELRRHPLGNGQAGVGEVLARSGAHRQADDGFAVYAHAQRLPTREHAAGRAGRATGGSRCWTGSGWPWARGPSTWRSSRC